MRGVDPFPKLWKNLSSFGTPVSNLEQTNESSAREEASI